VVEWSEVSERLRVAILGSTGSIGRQALDVAKRHADRVEIVALAAGVNADALAAQATEFGVATLALADKDAAEKCAALLGHDVGAGPEAVIACAVESGAELVLNALVGAAGLRATLATLEAGLTLALANKESLVVGGELVTRLVSPGKLIPVDSEHSAIFQCFRGEPAADATRIWLTASGGPFRGRSREELATVTPKQALAHPTWAMGPKITIDSATLMNKGLEVIEAHHLFGMDYDSISVVVQPQSCIHSMVEFADGSVKAHLGATDMRIPIQYAFSYPVRWDGPLDPVDFTALGRLDFDRADAETFGCLRIAYDAGRAGGTTPAVMNAANEVAVAAFLGGRCSFLDIERVVASTLEAVEGEDLVSIDQVEDVDARSRAKAAEFLAASAAG
jgi:1-deoxy-D-xylulose-5-phosphate reductoisomerase